MDKDHIDHVDQVNQFFYNRFTFPPPPMNFSRIEEPGFEMQMINQGLGGWFGEIIPRRPRIWVAGCGKYQAIQIALRFPTGQVVGTDLADASLAECQKVAEQLGLENLTLRQESLFEAPYIAEFDYVVCVGVLHHLAEPSQALKVLTRALRPKGVLELMVYNRFHRIASSAYQEAIRILSGDPSDLERSLQMARTLLSEFPAGDRLGRFVELSESEALFADTFLQPVEHTYTVSSLAALALDCGLEFLQPRVADWDRAWNSGTWNLTFQDEDLGRRYGSLNDLERWKVTNLVRREDSPLLWFYFQKKGCGRPRKSERDLAEEFQRSIFVRRPSLEMRYHRSDDGVYRPISERREYPLPPVDEDLRRVLAAVDGRAPMAEVLCRAGIDPDLATAHRFRLLLTTSQHPYLTFLDDPALVDFRTEEMKETFPSPRLGIVPRRGLALERKVDE